MKVITALIATLLGVVVGTPQRRRSSSRRSGPSSSPTSSTFSKAPAATSRCSSGMTACCWSTTRSRPPRPGEGRRRRHHPKAHPLRGEHTLASGPPRRQRALAGDGAVIVAHENVRRRMSVDGFVEVFDRKFPASPPQALPIVTFTRDVTFHLGGGGDFRRARRSGAHGWRLVRALSQCECSAHGRLLSERQLSR